jgi:hypothetical protein
MLRFRDNKDNVISPSSAIRASTWHSVGTVP